MAMGTNLNSHKKCCRTCLKEGSLMFDIFLVIKESKTLADMLETITKLKIQKDDELPHQICRYCFNQVVGFTHFVTLALEAEYKLKLEVYKRKLSQEVLTTANNESIQTSTAQFKETDVPNKSLDLDVKVENNYHDIFESHNSHDSNDINFLQNKDPLEHNFNYVDSALEIKIESTELNCVYCNKPITKLSQLKHHKEKHLDENKNRHLFKIKQNDSAPLLLNNNPDLINVKDEPNDFECYSTFDSKSYSQNDKKYSSKESDNIFTKTKHLKQHIAICDNCLQVNSSSTILPKENVNTNNILSETNNQFQCSKCLITFKNMNSLSAHMRKHTERGRIISCKECNKVFKKLSHLKRHEIQHGTNCPFKCNVCPKHFPTKDSLEEHMNKHRGLKPHGCPVCKKRFSHLSTLTTHIKMHTCDKTYLCPTCGRKFNSHTNLGQHMLRHTGLKKFACKLCPKRFISKGELKSHHITHTGERPHTCDQCGASFTKNSSLTKHKARHLGIKPHKCETCSMSFTCKDHLKRHHRTHTGEKPYKCQVCDRAFTQSNDLVKHRRAHVGDKVYTCPQCPASFRLNAELRQHISEHFMTDQMKPTDVSKETTKDGVTAS